MVKDDKIFLHHILECLEIIEEYTDNLSIEEFSKSTQKQDAIIRRI